MVRNIKKAVSVVLYSPGLQTPKPHGPKAAQQQRSHRCQHHSAAPPNSCKLPAKLLRLVGMAVGIQAAKDAVETQVCEIENGHHSAH